MGNILPTSQAFGVGVGVDNTPLSTSAQVKRRKLLFFATATNSEYPANTPVRVLSPDDAADRFGLGSTAHRMAIAAWKGHGGAVPTFISIGSIASGVKAEAGVAVGAGAGHRSGTIALYVSGVKMQIAVGATDSAEVIASHIAQTVNANTALPFTAQVDGDDAAKVKLQAREAGVYCNGVTLALNARADLGETLPIGVTLALSQFSGGQGLPDMQAALAALGTGDSQNKDDFTAVGHVCGLETTALDALHEYNGIGNEMAGDWSQAVARPFRSAVCDTAKKGSSGMSGLVSFGNTRKTDRTTLIASCPFTLANGHDVAAEFLAKAELYNASQAGGSLSGMILSGADVLADGADNFTTEYANRDGLLAAGITPFVVEDGVTQTTNTVTSYHSSAVSPENNAYRRFVDISKTQNALHNIKQVFSSAKWRGFTVVKDAGSVGRPDVRAKCRDRIAVIGDLLMLVDRFYDMGILFDKTPSINSIKSADSVTIRPDGGGFNLLFDMQYSGEGGIISARINIDTAVSS